MYDQDLLDIANYFDTVTQAVSNEHGQLIAMSIQPGDSRYAAWMSDLNLLSQQYLSLQNGAMAFRNAFASSQLDRISASVSAIHSSVDSAQATITKIADFEETFELIAAVVSVAAAAALTATSLGAGIPALLASAQGLATAISTWNSQHPPQSAAPNVGSSPS